MNSPSVSHWPTRMGGSSSGTLIIANIIMTAALIDFVVHVQGLIHPPFSIPHPVHSYDLCRPHQVLGTCLWVRFVRKDIIGNYHGGCKNTFSRAVVVVSVAPWAAACSYYYFMLRMQKLEGVCE